MGVSMHNSHADGNGRPVDKNEDKGARAVSDTEERDLAGEAPPTLASAVVAYVKDAILRGDFPPGCPLPEISFGPDSVCLAHDRT